jgi:demethylmenaquinone methyltransferase/2-methoxy-6-polyprenyl-1,4-benzoquinol methylase
MARLHGFLAGFQRIFSQNAKVVFIDNAYVEGNGIPISRDHRSGDTYQVWKLDHGSIHEVLRDFPTESELRAAVDGLAKQAWAESPRYYWILSYLLETDALPIASERPLGQAPVAIG